jgi:hypothetical protein
MIQYDGFDEELRDSVKDVLLGSVMKNYGFFDRSQGTETYISALILSVVCTSLYQNKDKILTCSLITDSIENFYNDIIGKCNISVEERNVIASVLVDKDKRVRVASDCSALEKIGFNKKYKNALLQNRLIKRNIVNGVEYIELIHDSLIDIVKKHKDEALHIEIRRRRRRLLLLFVSIVLFILFFVHYLKVKNNEKKLLELQVEYCCTKSRELSVQNNIDAIRLLMYLSENNKECFNNATYVNTVRDIDITYTLVKGAVIMFGGDMNCKKDTFTLSRKAKMKIDIDKLMPSKSKTITEILDKWSEILGPNAELTKEEKAKYHIN